MDRRAKKIEKARKRREQVKKRERAQALVHARDGGPLIRSAARAPFGPCWLSAGWDDDETPALVTAVITRKLGDGRLLPAIALVDRTCLGVKDGYFQAPVLPSEVDALCDRWFASHGGAVQADVLTVQSVVFHAIDYARRLGFEPHRDFPAALFGPRPDTLVSTPWHAVQRPNYIAGPHDDVRATVAKLTEAVGESGFDFLLGLDDDTDFEDDDEHAAADSLPKPALGRGL